MFCKTCGLPICVVCVLIKHKSHNLSDLSEKMEEDLNPCNINWKRFLIAGKRILSFCSSFIKKKKRRKSPRTWLKQIDKLAKKCRWELNDLKKEKGAKFQKQVNQQDYRSQGI